VESSKTCSSSNVKLKCKGMTMIWIIGSSQWVYFQARMHRNVWIVQRITKMFGRFNFDFSFSLVTPVKKTDVLKKMFSPKIYVNLNNRCWWIFIKKIYSNLQCSWTSEPLNACIMFSTLLSPAWFGPLEIVCQVM